MPIELPAPDAAALFKAMANDTAVTVTDDNSIYSNKMNKAPPTSLTTTNVSTLIAYIADEHAKNYNEALVIYLNPGHPYLLQPAQINSFLSVLESYVANANGTAGGGAGGKKTGSSDFSTLGSGNVGGNKAVNISAPTQKSNPWFAPSIMAAIAKYMDEVVKTSMLSSLKSAQMGIQFFTMMGATANDVKNLYLDQAKQDAAKDTNNAMSMFSSAAISIGSAGATLGVSLALDNNSTKAQEAETKPIDAQSDDAETKATTAKNESVQAQSDIDAIDAELEGNPSFKGQKPTASDSSNPEKVSPKRTDELLAKKASLKSIKSKADANEKEANADVAKYKAQKEVIADKYTKTLHEQKAKWQSAVKDLFSGIDSVSKGTFDIKSSALTLQSGQDAAFAGSMKTYQDMFNQLYSQSKDAQKNLEDEITGILQTWTKIADANKESFEIRTH